MANGSLSWSYLIERKSPRRPGTLAHVVVRGASSQWKSGWTHAGRGVCGLCGHRHAEERPARA